MSSVLRACGTTETETETATGSGGKIVRRRRAVAAVAHPYLRPESPPRSENPSWISGLLVPAARTIATGAGKLLSSVVFGSSPRDCSTCSSSDDDEFDGDSDDDSISSKEDEKSNQNGMAPVSTKDFPPDTQPTSLKSESKRAIERLLLQETFTRDECVELMEIIQSRVVDCPTMKEGEDATQKELYGRTIENDITFPGAWRSLSQSRKTPEAYPYSMNGLSALSSGGAALQVHTPYLCNTAIMEAKKWIEEKKLESSSNSERDNGPFPLSTNVLTHVIEGETASPVDMAKSYMRSRPPWASLALNNIEFKTPPPIGILRYTDESPQSMTCYSLPSTKDLKRNSLSVGSWDCSEETRRVRLKSSYDILENHAFKQIDSSAIFYNKPTQTLSVPDKGEVLGIITHDSSSLPTVNSNASPNLPVELTVDESCQNGVIHPSDEKAVEANLLVTNHVDDRTTNLTSIRSIPASEETVGAEDLRHGISKSADLRSETEHSGLGKGILASHPIIFISEKNKDLEYSQMIKEVVRSDTASHESPVPDSISGQHDGADLSAEKLNSEPEAIPSERDECVLPSDADGVVNHNNTLASSPQISSQAGKVAQVENSPQLYESPSLEEAYSLLGSILQDEDQMEKEADGLGNRDDINHFLSSQTSLSMALNAEPGLIPDETAQNSTSSDHGELAVDKPMENCELSNEVSTEAPATSETNTSDGLQNGTNEMMDDPPKIQPEVSTEVPKTSETNTSDGLQNGTNEMIDDAPQIQPEVSTEVPATSETNTSDGLQNGTNEAMDEAPQIQPRKKVSAELSNEVSTVVPATSEMNTSDGLQNGTSETMDETPQIQPRRKVSAKAAARAKKVGYSRRGRGRGK